MEIPRVGSFVVYEPAEEGWEDFALQAKQLEADLAATGVQVVSAPEPVKDIASCERVGAWFGEQRIDLLHALIVTWSFDHYSILIQQAVNVPLAVRSIPGIRTGSLVAGEQLGCLLADIQTPYRLFFAPLGNPAAAEQTAVFARACMLKRRLFGARIAVIGRRTEGMTPTAVDEVEILRLFGIRLLNYGLDEFYEFRKQVTADEARNRWRETAAKARNVASQEGHGVSAMQNYLALKQMAQDLKLNAISIGSYPQCQGTMCVPIGLLNDDGIPTGCEGDVNSTIAMLILSLLSGSAVHFGEMLDVDRGQNTIVSSHCGCGSPSLANQEGYILCPVRLANDGVCIRYAARTGPVTFVNLVGRKGNYRMCAFEGEAVPTPLVFEGNPLKFVMNSPFEAIWEAIARHGFGHHWMTAYTHAAQELSEFCQLMGIHGVFPDLEGGVQGRFSGK